MASGIVTPLGGMKFNEYIATSFSNLDSIVVKGSPYIADVKGTEGAPTGHNRWLVLGFENAGGNFGFQLAMTFDSHLYKRCKVSSNSWGAWTTIS